MVLSARTGEGIDQLRSRILDEVRGELREVKCLIPLSEGKLVDLFEKRTEVLEREYSTPGMVELRARVGRRQLELFLAGGASFTVEGREPLQALHELWPTPSKPREPRIPPHISLQQR